jgi:Fic family protein
LARTTGKYQVSSVSGESVRAFIPHPLPPADPPLRIAGELERRLAAAQSSVDRLNVAGRMVPNTHWFLYGFVRKEAVISSQIEGTQATLREIATYEATESALPSPDVEEVCNYVAALTYARGELAKPRGLPLSRRLLCECHRRLMRGVRGEKAAPGAIRKTQNWIGGTRPGNARFVPPPPSEVAGALDVLDKWIHSDDALPPLIRTGLAHVQFETIHPFLDGNGRIGRLLIALLLEHWQVMPVPLLYLSVAFKRRQREYYDRLDAVRTHGDWEGWTSFYLQCVQEAADDGVDVAGRLFERLGKDRKRLGNDSRTTVAALRLLDLLPDHPVVSVARAAKMLKVTAPSARKAIAVAVDLGILCETSGKRRDKLFAYHHYLQILTGDDS